MKYLSKYKIFESDDGMVDGMVDGIRDIILPLSDIGLKNTGVNFEFGYNPYILVKLIDYNDKPRLWYEIEDEVLRIIEFTKDEFRFTNGRIRIIDADNIDRNGEPLDPGFVGVFSDLGELINTDRDKRIAYLQLYLNKIKK